MEGAEKTRTSRNDVFIIAIFVIVFLTSGILALMRTFRGGTHNDANQQETNTFLNIQNAEQENDISKKKAIITFSAEVSSDVFAEAVMYEKSRKLEIMAKVPEKLNGYVYGVWFFGRALSEYKKAGDMEKNEFGDYVFSRNLDEEEWKYDDILIVLIPENEDIISGKILLRGSMHVSSEESAE